MAKIVYAVAGEGFGHSSRSHLIGQKLIDCGHDVVFAGSNKSLMYLREHFGDRVKEIFGFTFDYKNGKVHPFNTIKKNVLKLPIADKTNRKLFKGFFEKFKPDLIVSDFEPFSAWWALRNNVPFFSIDHQHMLTHCKIKRPKGCGFSMINAYMVTRCYYVSATSYIIINFFKAPVKRRSALVAPPIVRPEVLSLKADPGEYVVLYTTTGINKEQLQELLGKFGSQKFHIYGFDEYAEDGNCIFKERSTKGFLEDVAGSKGVVASAGFSLISECMYLKKKMLLLPLAGQYEQFINAHYVQTLGLGLSRNELNEQNISDFLAETQKPTPEDERILWPSNERFFKVLQQQLGKLDKPITLAPTS